jgi:hypothetical protein
MTKTEKEVQRLSEAIVTQIERAAKYEANIEDLAEYAKKKLEETIDKQRDQISTFQTQTAVLQANFADLTKRWDESDRRRWTVFGVMIAAGLSFLANLILLFLKR